MDRKLSLSLIYILFTATAVFLFTGAGFAETQDAAPAGAGQNSAALDQSPMFTEIDADKDGKATEAEWKAAGAPDMVFQMSDADKNGCLTLDELGKSSPPAAVDKDKDGKVTLSEVKEFMASMPAQGGDGGAAGGAMPTGGFVANSPHVGDGPTGQDFIDLMDTNKDGKIDHGEWEATKGKTVYKNKRWPHYNKNMDEYITLDEAPQKGVNWEEAPTDK